MASNNDAAFAVIFLTATPSVGVEVHAANGYLVDQFLQSKTNERTDKYGGSIEKRFTFLNEILDEILTVSSCL